MQKVPNTNKIYLDVIVIGQFNDLIVSLLDRAHDLVENVASVRPTIVFILWRQLQEVEVALRDVKNGINNENVPSVRPTIILILWGQLQEVEVALGPLGDGLGDGP